MRFVFCVLCFTSGVINCFILRMVRLCVNCRTGFSKKVSKWWIELRDHNEIVRRFAGFRDKAATEGLGQQIERMISYKVAGLPPDPQLSRWLEQIPAKLRKRFIDVGLLDASRAAATKPLREHIADFVKTVRSRSKEKHAKQTRSYLVRIMRDCGLNFWSDVRSSDIENYIGGNTFAEIMVAFFLNKKIFLLNPIPTDERVMVFHEEIEGVSPIILNGNLDRI